MQPGRRATLHQADIRSLVSNVLIWYAVVPDKQQDHVLLLHVIVFLHQEYQLAGFYHKTTLLM